MPTSLRNIVEKYAIVYTLKHTPIYPLPITVWFQIGRVNTVVDMSHQNTLLIRVGRTSLAFGQQVSRVSTGFRLVICLCDGIFSENLI